MDLMNMDLQRVCGRTGQYSSAMEHLNKLADTAEIKSRVRFSPSGLNSQRGDQNEITELWKLRCKLLAEKYFNTLKDLKQSNSMLKSTCLQQIKELKKEMESTLIGKLQNHLRKMEEEDKELKKAQKEELSE